MTPTNSKTLFLFLCDQMSKLDKKEIDVATATAQSSLARQANVARAYELKKMEQKLKEKYGWHSNATYSADLDD